VKLLDKWGGFKTGEVVRFGRTKGERFIESGKGEQVKKQRAVNDPPVIETAVAPPPKKLEKAMIDNDARANVKAELKAKAKEILRKKDEAKNKKGDSNDRTK
jgi:hypothetical protein